MLGILVGPLPTSRHVEENDTCDRFFLNLFSCADNLLASESATSNVCASHLRPIQIALTVLFITVLPSSTLFGQPRAAESE